MKFYQWINIFFTLIGTSITSYSSNFSDDTLKYNSPKTSSIICRGSILFDDVNPSVVLPASNHYYTGTNGGYTWECWFKLDQPSGTPIRPLISAIDGVLFEDMYLGFGWNGGWFDEPATRLVFKVDGPNSTFPTISNCSYEPVGGFLMNVWYHTVGVMNYTTQTAKLFVNGQLVDSRTITTPPITRIIPTKISYNLNIDSSPLYGNMDEIRIWDKPLSNSEIVANYESCLSGTEQNLYLYYNCNQIADPFVKDLTINNLQGNFSLTEQWSSAEAISSNKCIFGCFEICDNGIDDNINGLIDEGCNCSSQLEFNNELTPNVFTPNNDSINDYFDFKNQNIESIRYLIYNRWGTLIADLNNPPNGWNGQLNNGEKCADGVYFFLVTGKIKCGKEFSEKGYLQLIR